MVEILTQISLEIFKVRRKAFAFLVFFFSALHLAQLAWLIFKHFVVLAVAQ